MSERVREFSGAQLNWLSLAIAHSVVFVSFLTLLVPLRSLPLSVAKCIDLARERERERETEEEKES